MKRIKYSSFVSIKHVQTLLLISMIVFGLTANAQPYTAFDQPVDFPAGGTGGAGANNFDGPIGIETGVKFRVSQPGFINGVWFYRGTSNTGTHTAHLWNTTGGAALKTATLVGGAAGWLYIPFATSYHVTTGVNYVASVHMPTGFYAVTGGYFSGPVTNDGITLLCNCDVASPNNGVFDYTGTPLASQPVSTFGGANYWIDVSFTPDFPLPVTLADFRAVTNSTSISLSWNTENEFHNKGFDVQRSNNGSDWYSINFVNGAPDGTTTRNYAYTDKGLAPGTYYYRLRQVDFDAKSNYSAIVSATVSGKGLVSLFQNYPNPFSGTTSIRFDLPRTQHARLSVVDLMGREVKVLTDNVSEGGSHIITLDATSFARQTYVIRLQTEDGILTRKITVK